MSSSFVHLSLHSEYSLADSVVRVKPLMSAVRERGMPAVAVTDLANLSPWSGSTGQLRRPGSNRSSVRMSG